MKLLKKICIIFTLVTFWPGITSGQEFNKNFGIGIHTGFHKMIGGEMDASMVGFWQGIDIFYGLSDKLVLDANFAAGWNVPRDPDSHFKPIDIPPLKYFRTWLLPLELNLSYIIRTEGTFRPYLSVGAGMLVWQLRYERWYSDMFTPSGWNMYGTQYNASGQAGLGALLALSNRFFIDVSGRYRYIHDMNLDNAGSGFAGYGANGFSNGALIKIGDGDQNNGILEFRLGLKILFGGPKDSDNDGILDKLDACPDEAEDFDGFEDEDGCPDLDNDGDGIPDIIDKCPNEAEDFDGFEDEDGCPDLDNDGDGIPDSIDKCPNEAEDFDGFEDEDGCPDLDNDGDGIDDYHDDCPNKPETFNGYKDEDGCPDEVPKQEDRLLERGVTLIFPGVTFEFGSTRLTGSAKLILDDVYQLLRGNREVVLEIRGFTDNVGKRSSNRRVSQLRAQSVKDYLVSKGINANRLRPYGFGDDKPIGDNSTPEGRAKNRRIEFIRVQ